MRLFLLFSLLSLCWTSSGQAQQVNSAAPGQVSEPAQAAITLYHQTIGRHAPLYSGPEYVDYTRRTEGHQFFSTSDWQRGSIFFDGVLYPEVPIMYDVVNDVLVIGYAEETDPIVKFTLVPDQVQYFTLPQHHFVHQQDSTSGLEKGFYDQLYNGKTEVLAKRKKTILQKPENIQFYESDRFYLFKDGQYHAVKNKGSVLKLLKEHKKELSGYMRAEHLNFKQQRETAIVKLAQRYDQVRAAQ
jgi:hypothetical protein